MTPEKKDKYLLRYDLQFQKGSFTDSELEAKGLGGCDALIVTSIIRNNNTGEPHEGSKSIAFFTVDGRPNHPQIPNTEFFQAFSHMAHAIKDMNCPEWQKKIAQDTHDGVKKHMNQNSAKEWLGDD